MLKIISLLLGAVPFIGAQEVITSTSELMMGRHMLPIFIPTEQTSTLEGTAPSNAGQAASYRILSGSSTLWEGQSGDSFSVSIPQNSKTLYLVSPESKQQDWQDMKWQTKGERTGSPLSGRILAKDHGVVPGTQDAGSALRALLSRCRESGKPCSIVLEKGDYHFRPEGSHVMSYYVSNHGQTDLKNVAIPLVDLVETCIEANDSHFICHGYMQPLLIMDSEKITLKDAHIRYEKPLDLEGKIIAMTDKSTTLQISPQSSWKIVDGKLCSVDEGRSNMIFGGAAFLEDGRMTPRPAWGDVGWTPDAKQVGENTIEFPIKKEQHGMEMGEILVMRSFARPNPAITIYRAKDTSLLNVQIHNSQGMGVLAQRSENITIRGGGCTRLAGHISTTSADATHFSNTRGLIDVEGALYESMMDDAINIHATCLCIEKLESPRQIICKYMEGMSVGFELFLDNDPIQFIHGQTLENESTLGKAKKVERIDENHIRITLQDELPHGLGEGDALENPDWYPEVRFVGNTVRWNRARGTLFTTPKPVLVQNNDFVYCSGSAILLAGDAQGWYESGRCLDVKIINNRFIHNLTSTYQFTNGVISIYPEVRKLDDQKQAYHENIIIRGNYFETHQVPLIYAVSTKGITFSDNEIVNNEKHAAMFDGKSFIFKACDDVNIKLKK